MKKSQLAHIIRAAQSITGQRIFVVVGSQAILAQYPEAPDILLLSNEADIYPEEHPELADDIDGAIGENSLFHQQFGYYAEGVGPETAKLPKNWHDRAYRLQDHETQGAIAICPEIHDLAVSKLIAGREKDVEWITAALQARILQIDILSQRLHEIEIAPEILRAAEARLKALSSP